MYVKSLKIENLRSFRSVHAEFLAPGLCPADLERPPRLPNVNVLLGTNGAGKSTVLDAIALALLSPLMGSTGYRPYALIRRGGAKPPKCANVSVDVSLGEQDLTGKRRKGYSLGASVERRGDVEFVKSADADSEWLDNLFVDSSPAFFFVGYGAMRRVEAQGTSEHSYRGVTRHTRYERVASLFEDQFALAPLRNWLPEWHNSQADRLHEIVRLIDKLMPKKLRFSAEMEAGEYLFKANGTSVPFGALSDGYRAYLGWISDLMFHLASAVGAGRRIVDLEGVVMVDEVDLHIHPAWQRTLIPQIAKALPRLQFIFTTHSPIIVGTLERANIWVIESARSGPRIERPDEEIFGLTADQILRTELFGLDSTRDVEFSKELDQLAQRAVKGDVTAAMTFMRKAARGEGAFTGSELGPVAEDPPEWLAKVRAGDGD